jgi:murein DD-endopeptidase MepM/ murein hydrolase activator NlpD
MKKLVLLLPILILVLIPVILFFISSSAAVRIDPAVRVLGTETPVKVQVTAPHGTRRVAAYIEQNNNRYPVFESTQPATRFGFWRKSVLPAEIIFPAGKKQAAAVQDGKAKLVVEVVSNDLRGEKSTSAADVEINTRPLTLTVDGAQHYVNQGGTELVTFTVAGYSTESGVRVGNYTFRSFDLPGKPGERFSLFAFPWDVPADTIPVVFARNPTGAEVTGKFWFKLFPKKFRSRDLDLSDGFLEKVVNQIDKGGPGDLLSRFLKINSVTRKQNNDTLSELRQKSAEKFLWQGPFNQLGNSKVESQFADQRSYIYKGKKVDQQMHLGFDLSVTKNVGVVAANSGKVLYASDLGIYGNCIVIDHGYGLQSIYGHLSQVDVKPGEDVKKGQVIGKSGATGLAGGDHLHYSMQVDGIQINPVEWWDQHWIQDRILSKVPANQAHLESGSR